VRSCDVAYQPIRRRIGVRERKKGHTDVKGIRLRYASQKAIKAVVPNPNPNVTATVRPASMRDRVLPILKV
jgi:hypothetical protein